MVRRALLAGLIFLFVMAGIARSTDERRDVATAPAGPAADVPGVDLTGIESRLAALEVENRALRAEIAALDRSTSREPKSTGTLLERYPVPRQATLCGESIPMDRADVHQRFEEEWARYLVNQHWLIKWQRRSRDIFPYVEAQLAAAGMPDDLKYILVVESGLESRAYSSAGAAGWWQFIHATGKRYGLTRDNVVDERRDLGLATEAAIAYLTRLHEEFQSWPLALSAYNAGEKRVRDEIAEQGESSYYDLSLPRETEAYWFKAAALKVLMENPAAYGVDVPDDPWVASVCDTVQLRVTDQRVQLRTVAAAAGISYREFRELNPAFRQSWVPRGTHRIVLPHDGVDALGEGIDGARVDARQPGDRGRAVPVTELPAATDMGGEAKVGLDPTP